MNEWDPKPRRSSSSCGTWVVGCLIVVIVGAVAGFFALRPKLTELAQGAKSGIQNAMAISSALSAKYQTNETQASFHYDNEGSTLVLTIVNSPILKDLSGEEAEAEAKQAAELARDTAKGKGYDHYRVAFEQRSTEGSGASQSSQTFTFDAADLAAATSPAPPEPPAAPAPPTH